MKVRDAIRKIEDDGWRFHSQKGSHAPYKHPLKKGRVTIAGKPNRKMKYAIVIERAPGSNYSAFAPDLPGCVATGDTLEEVKRLMREGIEFHLQGMREDGDPIPEPTTEVAYVEAPAA